MKLFVHGPGNQKVYLSVTALSREQLMHQLGSKRFQVMGNIYNINQVFAEVSDDNISAGALVGGLIGILGGGAGILLGSAVGGLIGNESDNIEKERVLLFNSSKV